MDTYDIPVADLLLDVRNPRHDPVDTQEEQIAALVKDDQVRSLATDIAMNGLSPIEKPIVLYDEDAEKYIVLEGNRRVCSLILLHNPMLAPAGVRSAFNNMSKDKVPESIECALAESREEARLWIERRHSGLSGGIGLKSWNAIQKTRASDAYEKPNDNSLALALFEYAKKHLNLDCSEKKASLTTATRYLGNNKFRNTMGIRSRRTNKVVRIACSHSEFESILFRFLSDLIENDQTKEFGVHSRTKKLDIENYANHLVSEGLAPRITERESSLIPRPKSTPHWNPDADSNSHKERNTTSDTRDRNENGSTNTGTDASTGSDSYNNSGGEQSVDENHNNPSDLSDLDLTHTKKNRIPASGEIINKLNLLADPKLTSLYKSICTISVNTHPSLLYAGTWMFFEAMAVQYDTPYDKGLEAYLNQLINQLFPNKSQRPDLKSANHNLAQYVNSIKHSGKYYSQSASQLPVDFETIEPLTLKMLDNLIAQKNSI
jgi:hypothetical protein